MSKKPKAKKTVSQALASDLEPSAPAAQTPPPAQPLILLPGMKAEGNQLEEHQLRFAVELAEKFPQLATAVLQFRTAMDEAATVAIKARDKYRSLVTSLRDCKLNRRESTLFLKAYDLHKVVISKICNLVEADDATYTQYITGEIGFNAAVLLTQGAASTPAPGTAAGGDNSADEGEPSANTEAKKQERENPFPKTQADAVFALLEQFAAAGLKPSKNGKPYVFTYQGTNSVRYFLTCSVL